MAEQVKVMHSAQPTAGSRRERNVLVPAPPAWALADDTSRSPSTAPTGLPGSPLTVALIA